MMIRAATAADCAELARIDAQDNLSAWSEKQFLSALANRLNTVLLNETHHQISGFIVWQSVCGESELHLIAVDRAFRRQGIADALMEQWLNHAAAGQLTRLLLEVRDSNHQAQSLYHKHGFKISGRRKAYYTLASGGSEDAVLMEHTG